MSIDKKEDILKKHLIKALEAGKTSNEDRAFAIKAAMEEFAEIKVDEYVSTKNIKGLINTSNENYILRKHKLNGNLCFDIDQVNLVYSDCSPSHHGLQCMHMHNGDTSAYNEIMVLCDQVVEIFKRIDKLNELPDELSKL